MTTSRLTARLVALSVCLLPLAHAFASEGGAEAAEHGEHHVNWIFAGSLIVNFVLFIAIMVWLLRKPAVGYFAKRSEEVAKRLAAADEARAAAQAKLKEYEAKIDELLSTRDEVLARARKEAESERERVLAAAKEQSERMAREAEHQLEQALTEAKRQLSREAVQRLTAEAEAMLKKAVTPEDLVRLADTYIDSLKEVRRA